MPEAPGSNYDCVIVGGGPAGLTAAIYLARFHLSVAVLDAGRSRALMIPVTHNHAGFPGGIEGAELVRRMREQARLYGAACFAAKVTGVKSASDGFLVSSDGPCGNFTIENDRLALDVPKGRFSFDSAYAALGSDVHSELAVAAGARTSAEGCILVDRHQATSVEGLYAAGDVVLGLDRIGNAMGQAGVAATAIRNAICLREPLRRNEARAALKL